MANTAGLGAEILGPRAGAHRQSSLPVAACSQRRRGESARPLVGRDLSHAPDWECVISATSVTGYTLARKKYSDYTVFYCPLDFSWAVRGAMRRIRPDGLVLAELELWPNLIRAGARSGGPRGDHQRPA